MADIKFSQFTDGGDLQVGDIVVGLRSADNYKFDFPSTGFKDGSGNYLMQYASAGAAAVNYIKFTNSNTGNSVIISSDGTDADVDIDVQPKGVGLFNINTTTGVDQILDEDTMVSNSATALATQQSIKAYVDSTAGGLVDSVTGTANEVDVDNTDPANPVLSLSSTIVAPGTIAVGNLFFDTNTISSTDVNGNVNLTPNGSGAIVATTTEDAAAVELMQLQGDRATPAINDEAQLNLYLSNTAGTQVNYGRIAWIAKTIGAATEDGAIQFDVIRAGTLEEALILGVTEIVVNESGVDRDFRVEASGEANALFVQGSSGNLGLGTASPQARIEALGLNAAEPTADWFTTATFGVAILDDQTQTAQLTAFAGNTATERPLFYGRRSRGTLDVPAVVVAADVLFSVIASGFDGTDFQQGATINFVCDDTVSAGAVPTALQFQTGDSFGTRANRLTIDSNGLIQMGAANASVTTILDEDNMVSDSATALATQQSIKAYVDGLAPSALPSPGGDGTFIRADTGAWATSTLTLPNALTLNGMLYASSANTAAELTAVNNAVLGSSATGVPTWNALADGELLIGSSSGAPIAATLTAGAGISITEGANSITIAGVASGMGWNTDATGTIAAAVDTGYVCGAAGLTTATLPATAAVGSVVALEGLGAGGWSLVANTGQTIQIGSGVTSSAGSLSSVAATDNVYVLCIVADVVWRVTTTNSAGLTIA